MLWKQVLTRGRAEVVFDASDGLEPIGRGPYLHWDKLRHLKPPGNLTHEEWWLTIKARRKAQYQQSPVRDADGAPFRYAQTDWVLERLHQIDKAAAGRIEVPDQILNPETRDRYLVESLIEEAITSSQLEGAATTRQVAKDMLRAGRKPSDQSERGILNNFLTMQRIRKWKEVPLTRELVLDIQRTLGEGALDKPDAAGRFRREDEHIDVGDDYGNVFHQPPPAGELEERVESMCAFANEEIPKGFVHPVLRSVILHFWLAYDHPFVDGNGRTARALFYWSMLHHGYWLCEYISISEIIRKAPAKYGRAFLYTETDDNDLTYFLIYHLDVIRRAIKELQAYFARKTKQLQDLERELRGIVKLNHRQRALVSHALRHPQHRYLIESHLRSHNVVYQTARTDLLNLKDLGLLEGQKVGREWQFTPAPDLEQKLRDRA